MRVIGVRNCINRNSKSEIRNNVRNSKTQVTKTSNTEACRSIENSDFPYSNLFRISDFSISSFHIPNWRESRDWFANSRQLSRSDYFVDVFVSWAGFLSEARP